MIETNWKELGTQVAVGALMGAATVLATTQSLSMALLSALAVGILRGGAQYVIDYLTPRQTAINMKLRKVHWSEKWKKYL